MGTVRLTVSDLSRSRAFYEESLGLAGHPLADGELALGVGDERALVALREDRSASTRDPRATGLFHLAVLLPSRLDLAHALRRLAESRWPLDGASDHLVSEALYLSDPDGNGIEIYRDRPRDEWTHGEIGPEMATLPLDLRSLADELEAATGPQPEAPAETTIGHVHLQVAELREVERFYAELLGFDVTVRGYPGALFVSAGGYHHHLGLNTWHSAGSAAPAPGALGLRSYEILLPDEDELARVTARLADAGIAAEADPEHGGHLVRDPSGNAALLRAA
jgi:catechol 2,3-dioxygenase